MKRYFYMLIFLILLVSCKKDKVATVKVLTGPKVTSPEYVDSLLFINTNGYQIQTNDTSATFECSDPHISMTSKGLVNRLTSAETVQIMITGKNGAKTTIYALGATDNNQDEPFLYYQGALATNACASYMQGWKTLEQLPVSGETYAIVLRHADASCGTDFTIDHNYEGPADWWESSDSTLARQLNAQGIVRATEIGQVFKDLKYPIKRVITSEFYRARQTAALINAGPVPTEDGRINHPSYNMYPPGLYLGMVSILNEQPIDNQMTLIVAHHPINELRAVTGYPSFPDVSPFNWTGAYLIKISSDGTITYEGAASWGMFMAWRNLKLHKNIAY